MSYKDKVLQKLMGKVSEGTEWALDKLDTPSRATRAAIGAYQNDEDVLDAIKGQFSENAPEAPSGIDIAEKFGEDFDIQNPYALGAIATAADVIDPTMLIPGGQASKFGKLSKIIGKSEKAGDILRAGAKMDAKAEKTLAQIGKARAEVRNPAEALRLRNILSDPKNADNPLVKQALAKTGQVSKTAPIVAGDKVVDEAANPLKEAVQSMAKSLDDNGHLERLRKFKELKAKRLN